jgi:tetratricopeptide (TPR) repeat protein
MAAGRRSAVALAAWLVAAAMPLGAQDALDAVLVRAMQAEDAGRYRDAAHAYRQGLSTPNVTIALLGMERAYAQLGWNDSTVAVIDSVLRTRPLDPVAHTVQLRALHTLGRRADLRAAFESWVRGVPNQPDPYREFVRLLLDGGDAATADTILGRAQSVLGSADGLRLELADTRAKLGRWEPAARAWRDAVTEAPYLEQAATISLTGSPPETHDAVRAIFSMPPMEIVPRGVLAGLELAWGSPRRAWDALRELPRSDSTIAEWRDFAERAEARDAWAVVRDALQAVLEGRSEPDLAARAATAALKAGEPASALALAERASAGADSASVSVTVLTIRVRALGLLGRPADAVIVATRYAALVDDAGRAALAREVAWAWLRVGDMGRARTALANAAGSDGMEEIAGWIALYEGDLATARRLLRLGVVSAGDGALGRAGASADAVQALALLSRTRADSAPSVGRSYLALVRGDTALAIRSFEDAASTVTDAAAPLLAAATRLRAARRDDAGAITGWTRIVAEYPESPEAAESDLDWARALRRTGDAASARKRLEHLVLTYPESALVPQARRELDLLRTLVPPPEILLRVRAQ